MKKRSLSRHTDTSLNLTPHYKANKFDGGGAFDNLTSAGLWDNSTKATLNNTGGAGNVGGVFAGIEGMLESGLQNAKLKSTYNIQSNIADNFGLALKNQNLNTNDELMQAWDEYNPMSHISRKDIRGGSTLGRLWNTNMASIKGAEAGWNAGGPWGAAIGGIVGLGTGIAGWVTGGRKASRLRDKLNAEIDVANEVGYQALANQQSNVEQKNLLRAESNYVAYGGPIENPSLDKTLAGKQMEDIYGNGIPSVTGEQRTFESGGELPIGNRHLVPVGTAGGIFMFGDEPTPEQLAARRENENIFGTTNFVDRRTVDQYFQKNKFARGGSNIFVSTDPASVKEESASEHKSQLHALLPFIMQVKQQNAEMDRLKAEQEYNLALEKERSRRELELAERYASVAGQETPQQQTTSDTGSWDDLYNSIMSFESFSEVPRPDSNGKYAIGYGDQDQKLVQYYLDNKDKKFTKEEGVKQLARTVDWVKRVLASKIPNWGELTPAQQKGLVSLGYNTGPYYVINSPGLMEGLAEMDWDKVVRNMNAGWNQVDDDGKPLRGLRKRRNFERLPFLYPDMTTYGTLPDGTVVNPDDLLNVDLSKPYAFENGIWSNPVGYREAEDGTVPAYVSQRAYGGNLFKDGGSKKGPFKKQKYSDPVKEQLFQNWYKEFAEKNNLNSNPDDRRHYYDYRAYWESLNNFTNPNNNIFIPSGAHSPDTYKLPGHPTMSVESIYQPVEKKGKVWNTTKPPLKYKEYLRPETDEEFEDRKKRSTLGVNRVNEGGYSSSIEKRKATHRSWDPTGGFNLAGLRESNRVGNQSHGEENEYWRAYMGLPNYVPDMNPKAKTEWDDQVEFLKKARMQQPSDFYGTTPRMDQMFKVLADTLHTGDIVRNYDLYKSRYPDISGKDVFEHMYLQGKNVLNNPSKWTQVIENPQFRVFDHIANDGTNEKMPLGMLAAFGMKWEPSEHNLYIHDTYDFPRWVTTFSSIPKRPREMKIRGVVDFDPEVGADIFSDGIDLSKIKQPIVNKNSHRAYGGNLFKNGGPDEPTAWEMMTGRKGYTPGATVKKQPEEYYVPRRGATGIQRDNTRTVFTNYDSGIDNENAPMRTVTWQDIIADSPLGVPIRAYQYLDQKRRDLAKGTWLENVQNWFDDLEKPIEATDSKTGEKIPIVGDLGALKWFLPSGAASELATVNTASKAGKVASAANALVPTKSGALLDYSNLTLSNGRKMLLNPVNLGLGNVAAGKLPYSSVLTNSFVTVPITQEDLVKQFHDMIDRLEKSGHDVSRLKKLKGFDVRTWKVSDALDNEYAERRMIDGVDSYFDPRTGDITFRRGDITTNPGELTVHELNHLLRAYLDPKYTPIGRDMINNFLFYATANHFGMHKEVPPEVEKAYQKFTKTYKDPKYILTDEESKLLNDSYSGIRNYFETKNPGKSAEELNNTINSEMAAVNAEIRTRIGKGKLVGEALNKAIDDVPDAKLLDMLLDNYYLSSGLNKQLYTMTGDSEIGYYTPDELKTFVNKHKDVRKYLKTVRQALKTVGAAAVPFVLNKGVNKENKEK